MPDFEHLVAERLARLDLAPDQRRAVIAEVSAHLEEFYRSRVAAGSRDPEAETLAQVADWKRLSRRIRRAKADRMRMLRTVALPGLGAVILAWITFKASVFYLVQPVPCPHFKLQPGTEVAGGLCTIVTANAPMYFAWLATLPFAGALAAALARRAGATPTQRLSAALLPALALAIETIMLGITWGFFLQIPVYWVLAPAAMCILGALPFLGGGRDSRKPVVDQLGV